MREAEYHIELLGAFEMRAGKRRLVDTRSRTHQVWSCLGYILAHRTERIPQADLIAALWPNGEITEPENALKNIIYRVRTLLAQAFPEEQRPFIRNSRGHYFWNSALACTFDHERFLRLSQQAGVASGAQRIRLLERAIALYRGPFLPRAGAEKWSAPIRAYYAHAYVESVSALGAEQLRGARFAEAIALAEQALRHEPYSAPIHALLIRALVGAGRFKEALAQYETVTKLLKETLGQPVPESIRELYGLIAKPAESVETDVSLIERSLRAEAVHEGPFECAFSHFQDVYGAYSHLIARTGQSMSLQLLTISEASGNVPDARLLAACMEALRRAACRTLRRTDILARYSPSQYLVLLSGASPEGCAAAFARLRAQYDADCPAGDLILTSTCCEMEPIG